MDFFFLIKRLNGFSDTNAVFGFTVKNGSDLNSVDAVCFKLSGIGSEQHRVSCYYAYRVFRQQRIGHVELYLHGHVSVEFLHIAFPSRQDLFAYFLYDDAIIITGTVVKKATASRDDYGNFNIGNNPNVRYSSFDKKSYIKHLARSFASKEYINLRFADNEVYQMGKGGESFAIQLSQEYYSSNYGDKGYLFLLVDVNDPLQPIIKVRTWQPEKDTHFKDRIQAGMLR